MTRSDPLQPILGPIDGAQIPGGCDACDAYQEPVQIGFGVWVIQVYHDDWCPIHPKEEG